MYFAVPCERAPGERRVALVPETVAKLVAAGHRVGVEAGAGLEAQSLDEAYRAAGAGILPDAAALYGEADIVLKIQGPIDDEPSMRQGTILIGILQPLRQPERIVEYAKLGVTAFSMDLMPRITRAQSMDVLSAMSTVAGYRATLTAAILAERFFPLLMTAAGTVTPARVLVLGAGVAGLQAVATAKRMGAVVQAFDTRPAVKEQVESLGATFLTLPISQGEGDGGYARRLAEDEERLEREFLAEPTQRADVVITTALVPGARSPLLIDEDMVASMHPGAVIVDLAAEGGGNCALTVPGERTVAHGVIIDGSLNLPAQMPLPASQLYSRNVLSFVNHLLAASPIDGQGGLQLNLDDEILGHTCVTHRGEVTHGATLERLQQSRT